MCPRLPEHLIDMTAGTAADRFRDLTGLQAVQGLREVRRQLVARAPAQRASRQRPLARETAAPRRHLKGPGPKPSTCEWPLNSGASHPSSRTAQVLRQPSEDAGAHAGDHY